MKKSSALCIAVIVGGLFFSNSVSQRVSPEKSSAFRGVYRFISETTEIRAPKPSKLIRTTPTWQGLYFFDNGYFSVTLENQARNDDWLSEFPKNLQELGYQSFAGRFEFHGSELVLQTEMALNSFSDGRPRSFEVSFDGDRLLLTERLVAYIESKTEGTRVTILQRVDSSLRNK